MNLIPIIISIKRILVDFPPMVWSALNRIPNFALKCSVTITLIITYIRKIVSGK